MPEIKWIKITTDMFSDEKIKLIEAMPEADALLVIWIRLICLAGRVNSNGNIFLSPDIPYNDEDLATIFNRPLNTVRLALATFKRYGMLEIDDNGVLFLPNFSKHQNIEGMQKIREQTKNRVAKHREKQKLLREGSNVTSRYSNATDKNRLDKNRKEESSSNGQLPPDILTILTESYQGTDLSIQAVSDLVKRHGEEKVLKKLISATKHGKCRMKLSHVTLLLEKPKLKRCES
jgi:predicted phage replisome organizer